MARLPIQRMVWLLASSLVTAACFLFAASCSRPMVEPLRIGIVVWPPYEMAYLAQDLGYFTPGDIDLIDFASPADFVLAYQSGTVDAVATTLDYALELQTSHADSRVVMVLDVSLGGDALVARSDVTRLDQLTGLRIGYEASALGAYMLQRALESGNIPIESVKPVPLDTFDQHAAFERGDVDAVVTYEPTVTLLVDQGANVVFDSSMIPGEVVDVLVTSTDVIENRGDQLAQFAAGWFRALDYFRMNPEAAADMVAGRQNMTPEQFLRSFDGVEMVDRQNNRDQYFGSGGRLVGALERHERAMRDRGLLLEPVDVTGMIDATLFTTDG